MQTSLLISQQVPRVFKISLSARHKKRVCDKGGEGGLGVKKPLSPQNHGFYHRIFNNYHPETIWFPKYFCPLSCYALREMAVTRQGGRSWRGALLVRNVKVLRHKEIFCPHSRTISLYLDTHDIRDTRMSRSSALAKRRRH